MEDKRKRKRQGGEAKTYEIVKKARPFGLASSKKRKEALWALVLVYRRVCREWRNALEGMWLGELCDHPCSTAHPSNPSQPAPAIACRKLPCETARSLFWGRAFFVVQKNFLKEVGFRLQYT
jgi:hypothetical protein